jgi:hypothetical protein
VVCTEAYNGRGSSARPRLRASTNLEPLEDAGSSRAGPSAAGPTAEGRRDRGAERGLRVEADASRPALTDGIRRFPCGAGSTSCGTPPEGRVRRGPRSRGSRRAEHPAAVFAQARSALALQATRLIAGYSTGRRRSAACRHRSGTTRDHLASSVGNHLAPPRPYGPGHHDRPLRGLLHRPASSSAVTTTVRVTESHIGCGICTPGPTSAANDEDAAPTLPRTTSADQTWSPDAHRWPSGHRSRQTDRASSARLRRVDCFRRAYDLPRQGPDRRRHVMSRSTSGSSLIPRATRSSRTRAPRLLRRRRHDDRGSPRTPPA